MSSLVFWTLVFVLGLLGIEYLFSRPTFSRVVTWLCAALACGLFIVGYHEALRGLFTGQLTDVDPWHVFHYDLNARYLDELGYDSLYTCALAADAEGANNFREVQEVRDLITYKIVPRRELSPCPRERFTPVRWQQFQQDVQRIYEIFSVPRNASYASWRGDRTSYWQAIFQDKGYNVSPFGARLTAFVLEYNGFAPRGGWRALFLSELLFFALAIVALARWYSGRVAAVFALVLITFWGTYPFLVNMLWQHMWLPLTVFGLLAWRKQKEMLSLCFLSIATFLRIFPGLFLLPILFSLFQTKGGGAGIVRWHLRIRVLLVLGSIAIGCIYWGGSWVLWRDYLVKILHHRAFLAQEVFNIGWPTLAQLVVPGNSRAAFIGSVMVTILYVGAVCRATVWQQTLLIPLVIYAWLSLSPYYYLVLLVLVLLAPTLTARRSWFSTVSILILFIGHALAGLYGLSYFSDQRLVHLGSEMGIVSLLLFHLWLVWTDTKEKRALEVTSDGF